jgi:hypothetical protein
MSITDQEKELADIARVREAEREGSRRVSEIAAEIRQKYGSSSRSTDHGESKYKSPMYPTDKEPVDHVPMGGAKDD